MDLKTPIIHEVWKLTFIAVINNFLQRCEMCIDHKDELRNKFFFLNNYTNKELKQLSSI